MEINYWAVLASAVASMIIGSLWYGPLFGKVFIHEQGLDQLSPEAREQMKKGMAWTFLGQFLASIVMFAVLDVVATRMVVTGVMGTIKVALLLWLGFAVTIAFGNALWGGKMKLFWLSIGNMFLTLLAAGAIIGLLDK